MIGYFLAYSSSVSPNADNHFYRLTGNAAADILATFPIIQRQDEARYHGRYRTRDLILAYLRAYAAGNIEAWVKG